MNAYQKEKVIDYDYLILGEDKNARYKDDTPNAQAYKNRIMVTRRDKAKLPKPVIFNQCVRKNF